MEQHAPEVRSTALGMVRQGIPYREISERLGVPRGTIGWWRHEERRAAGTPFFREHDCPRCRPRAFDRAAYSYLLGLYLGDGHIVCKPGQQHLSIFYSDEWPGLIAAAEEAIRRVMPLPGVHRRQKEGCTEVKSYSGHWPCLFPQHGPGRKHERPIVLAPWQREIVDEHGWAFVRGLVHSDGCRVVNWTTRLVGGQRKRYEYPRYFFTNTSADIIGLCTAALDALGVSWTHLRQSRAAQTVSVARRDSVALMDRHVGPKS
ncbi:hypothetical protein [Streptomyces marincola]|uniref:DOD-type homing endonuclease domain-containing protein n=1 Tax=Streptomyces marincola TaxID=2878388 RepID=A0A1W7D2S6_9ACTN|nr:hypothetical protein [Streptomyces marincola]ARQ71324.1 hypothetical protein CAG99_23060 [Streptomyces marincola]